MADQQFWTSFYNMGKHAGAKFPELVAAQAALESGWGEHLSGKNNYFGIKGSPGTVVKTREVIGGKEIFIHDEFKDFASPQECVDHLVTQWYKDYKGYKGVNRASTAQEAAQLLQEEGYATDPVYSELLINLMEDNQVEVEVPDDYFLPRAAKYYQAKPHQIEAWQMLEDSLEPELLEAFKQAYRSSPSNEIIPGDPEPEESHFPLNVTYFYQRDSATSHGGRMCFTSSMAMALDYVDPDKIDGDDDWYLSIVLYYGDTVSSDAQIKAARSLGYNASFHMDGTQERLEKLLDYGLPVPVGILHNGPLSKPSGGGHWICLIGHDDKYFYVHDPAGELDLISGGYPKKGPTDGKLVRYTKKNLMKRWLIANDHDGWYVKVD